MAQLIEDYALIGDTATAALVGRDGSVDWWCAPRFDAGSTFGALLDSEAGCWRLAPAGGVRSIDRTYERDTLVLATTIKTDTGSVLVRDFMRLQPGLPTIVRTVEGLEGVVAMRSELEIRFDYGSITPWVRAVSEPPPGWHGIDAVGGADGLTVWSQVPLVGAEALTVADFDVAAGQSVSLSATWHGSDAPPAPVIDPGLLLDDTLQWWDRWSGRCTYGGPWRDQVRRSLITLKALTFEPSGGIVAAPTTSLPEWIGGVRNWDYRYCWLRDATFTLHALVDAGYEGEAIAWSEWLRRSVAGDPEDTQIMYGVRGERRLTETELPALRGYEGSAPVRIGNGASEQFQLDVFGEVLDMFLAAATASGREAGDAVDLARFLVEHVAEVWTSPDDGIWEVRGPRRHFVHSKVMAWVAVDRWLGMIDLLELDDDPSPWARLRDEMHREICVQGYNHDLGAFTQYYGSSELDASCLMIGLVGFLPPDDPRLVSTVEAIERALLTDGFVKRYETAGDSSVDGLPPGEGAFLLTTFWLVDNLVLIGRRDDALELFERLVSLSNDVGLLSEEYDVTTSRMVGNFPQAFSHVGLINSAFNLAASAPSAGSSLTGSGSLKRRARSFSASLD